MQVGQRVLTGSAVALHLPPNAEVTRPCPERPRLGMRGQAVPAVGDDARDVAAVDALAGPALHPVPATRQALAVDAHLPATFRQASHISRYARARAPSLASRSITRCAM